MFAPDFKSEPYWWDRTPRPYLAVGDLPPSMDVAIVGSGYTRLNSAVITARGGRSTLVLDSGDAGFGCSTRNGGQISTSIKPSLGELTGRYGAQAAFDILKEGQTALCWIGEFIETEGLDCDFMVPGCFHAAHSPGAFARLARQVVIATDGYMSGLTPWLRRRVIPIGSYVIATEPVEQGLMDSFICSTDRAKIGTEVLLPLQAKLGAYVVAVKIDRARRSRERRRDVLS